MVSEQLIKVSWVKEPYEGFCISEGANLQSKWWEKFVRFLELIMAQQSEIMPGWCFLSPLIKMEILIMQKALCEVRNNGEHFVMLFVFNIMLRC